MRTTYISGTLSAGLNFAFVVTLLNMTPIVLYRHQFPLDVLSHPYLTVVGNLELMLSKPSRADCPQGGQVVTSTSDHPHIRLTASYCSQVEANLNAAQRLPMQTSQFERECAPKDDLRHTSFDHASFLSRLHASRIDISRHLSPRPHELYQHVWPLREARWTCDACTSSADLPNLEAFVLRAGNTALRVFGLDSSAC